MPKIKYIILLFLSTFFMANSQVPQSKLSLEVSGTVQGRNTNTPISGVEVTASNGSYTVTNVLGEFKIRTTIGEVLIIDHTSFETVRHTIKRKEDIIILVEEYVEESLLDSRSKVSKNRISQHKAFLDSANRYKKTDIGKSIDFITQSIVQLENRGNKSELAESLSILGEVYHYHGQYDLAIANYNDALQAQKSTRTSILLGNTYLLNKEFKNAETTFLALDTETIEAPYQQTQIYEGLGDAYKGLGQLDKAVDQYNKGLEIAKENLITPKRADLNSKIADAYAKDNRLQEAEGFFDSSLELANTQAPQRAIQEKEKVADFYNQKNQYDEEIALRKKSLNELKRMPQAAIQEESLSSEADSITSQRINYKIANAYIAQDKLDEAITYLEQSISEADNDDDLVVQKDATRKLSEVYKDKGNYTKALETYQRYVAVVDTLYVRKEQEISRAARFNREIASKQNRISGLEQERELSQSKYDLALTGQQLIQESNKRQKWIIYSLIFGMLLMGIAVFFFYRSNRQQKLANNLLALKSLRSQMNPHFIFNALNSVNNYIAKSDERSANRYLSDFSTLMRSVLENSEEDFIPLSKELELLELYTKLEHSRFPDKFEYGIKVDKELDIDTFQIPPMLLQPYIENAIWHGLRYKKEKGFLKIDLEQKDMETVIITIVDNGIGRKRSNELKTKHQMKQKSKGMGNIKKRIAILNDMYRNKVDVHISDLEESGTGTKVVLTLKKD